MGFGIFFLGYFLILNIAYFPLTDIIAVALMLFGLSKLSCFNRGFKIAFATSGIFLVFALFEFGFGAYDMLFSPSNIESFVSFIAIIRNFLLCLLNFTSFEGMREISDEVGLKYLAKKCKITSYAALPIYVLAIISETPALFNWTNAYTATVIAVISLLSTFIFTVINLFTIYSCYAKICMPEDKDNDLNLKSNKKTSLLSGFLKQSEERNKEYAEYKLQKKAQKNEKRK